MVKFTIDAVQIIMTTHRLQEDNTFKKVEEGADHIANGDKVFDDYFQADTWKKRHPVVEFDGITIENTGGNRMGDHYLDIRQHRTAKPANCYFTKEEVETVLRRGNDEVSNSLVVDYNGVVHLIPAGNSREGYAVRVETFQAGNGYVGSRSRLNHLENTYKVLLEGWLDHLETGDGEYRDYSDGQNTVEELQQKAVQLINDFKF
ncbi:hypothetical protein [Cohnella silvisoli]|uniref:Uncharacterized protein n=1 Tax=Cohnella silvisoli TaxID=2873699 RepID=A0ABV1L393_9BACL|nr:hypothetical protein [Cohnella silvisoli]MCD9026034.1 hypothetical protein [Cohnella silvisoli]